MTSEFHQFVGTLPELAGVTVTDRVRELDGIGKIHSHLPRRVGIRAERDRHVVLKRELEKLAARINLAAIFAEAGGVEFNGAMVLPRRRQEFLVKRRAVARGTMAEFLRQVSMADDLKQAAGGRHRQSLEIGGPHFEGVALFPFGKFVGIVHRPIVRDVMDRADEIIPRLPRGEIANPVLVARQVIHFERKADGEPRELALRAAHFLDVFIKLMVQHAPVVEVVAAHGRMIGEADFGEAKRKCVSGVIHRFAAGVSTERRVHVVIGRRLHRGEC